MADELTGEAAPTQEAEPTTETTETQATPTEEATPETQEVTTQEPVTESEAAPAEEAPKEEAPAEEAAPGIPQPDEYKLPDGVPKDFGKFAHEHGFTQEQVDASLQHFSGYVQAAEQVKLQALRSMGEKHLEDWGERKDYNLSLAKRALKQNDPDGKLAQALNESGYGNHPAVLDFLYNIGKSMQEGGFLKNAVARPTGKKSTAQALYPDLPSKEL